MPFYTKHDGQISEYCNRHLNMQMYDNLIVNNASKSVAHVTEYKVKFTLKQATKAQRGSTGIALLFL